MCNSFLQYINWPCGLFPTFLLPWTICLPFTHTNPPGLLLTWPSLTPSNMLVFFPYPLNLLPTSLDLYITYYPSTIWNHLLIKFLLPPITHWPPVSPLPLTSFYRLFPPLYSQSWCWVWAASLTISLNWQILQQFVFVTVNKDCSLKIYKKIQGQWFPPLRRSQILCLKKWRWKTRSSLLRSIWCAWERLGLQSDWPGAGR